MDLHFQIVLSYIYGLGWANQLMREMGTGSFDMLSSQSLCQGKDRNKP